MNLLIPHDRYDLVSSLHRAGAIESEKPESDGVHISGVIPDRMISSMLPFVVNNGA